MSGLRGGGSREIWVDASALTELNRRLRGLDAKVARAMNKKVREVAKPVVEDVKTEARGLPSNPQRKAKQEGTVGLREGIALATEFKMFYKKNGANARIRVSGSKFQAATGKYRKLPRYVEGLSRKPWRHPVFADKGVVSGSWKGAWAAQKSTPFMLPVVLRQKSKVRQELLAVFIAEVETQLNNGNVKLFK